MDDVRRRAFCSLLAASAATVSGCSIGSRTATRGPTVGDREEVTVTSRAELESAFAHLDPGQTIEISSANAPYRTRGWLDVDVDGVTVRGPGDRTLVEPRDGANVGGIRVGHNERCREIDIVGFGFDGNPSGQGSGATQLHGIAVENARDVTLEGCRIQRTYPRKHGNGGSGISVGPDSSSVRITGNRVRDFGDRGIQLGGEHHAVSGNYVTDGLDRPIACDVWDGRGNNYTARRVSIFGNLVGNSVEGSLVGVARNRPTASTGDYVSVVGNVGFGSHKNFCHVRGPGSLRNVSVQHNVSTQETGGLDTEETTQFAGVAVDVDRASHVAIKNNGLYGYSGHGINVDGAILDLACQQNDLVETGIAGIRLAGGCDGFVDGNLVSNATDAGIRLDGSGDVVVRGNYVRRTGTTGIDVGAATSGGRTTVVDNHVADTNRLPERTDPAIAVRDSGVLVRGNAIRQNGAPAIEEADGAGNNHYANNWADGDDAWRIRSPTSTVRDHTPAVDVHRGVSAASGSDTVQVEFDRPYDDPPRLAFGRTGGGVRRREFVTDDGGNVVGVSLTTATTDAPLDVFVGAR